MSTNMIIIKKYFSNFALTTSAIIATILLSTCLLIVGANTIHRTDFAPLAPDCKDDKNTASCTSLQQQPTTDLQASELTDHPSATGAVSSADLSSFRMEYNKYKILSHLGITSVVEDRLPNNQLDSALREKLLSSSAFQDNGNHNNTNDSISKSSRHKRSLTCSQVKSDKNACCMETLYVNFTDIGWDKWILYPTGYNANYCRGQCDLSHARYYHSTLLSKFSNTISLCCSPRQMAPLRLLYIDEENKVHQKLVPDMIVESCDCA